MDSDKSAPIDEPTSMGGKEDKSMLPAWARHLPKRKFPSTPNQKYHFVDPATLDKILKGHDKDVIQRIKDDIKYMDHELLRLFRERDHRAKQQQNLYRGHQIAFLLLSAGATLIGSLQALFLSQNPTAVAILAFFATVIALITAYIATISGQNPPLQEWLVNRQRAERLRREFFRYLLRLDPYDQKDSVTQKLMMSDRAADINRGINPDTGNSIEVKNG